MERKGQARFKFWYKRGKEVSSDGTRSAFAAGFVKDATDDGTDTIEKVVVRSAMLV